MKIINASTKRGQNLIASAMNYEGYSLSEVYGSYSYAKASAYESCRRMAYSEGGTNFHISSHNTFGFTVAWNTPSGMRIETPNNSYLVK